MEAPPLKQKRSAFRRWLHRGFIAWAIVSTLWLLNSYRTQGVAQALFDSDARVSVQSSSESLCFWPAAAKATGLVFIVGAGVAAEAYAPLLRPLAESGHPVFVVRLPFSIAPFESHKLTALSRVRAIIAEHASVMSWVIAGHSLGGALCSVYHASQTRHRAATEIVELAKNVAGYTEKMRPSLT